MGPGFLIEYLNSSKALLGVQALFKDLCGVDLCLLDLEGKAVSPEDKSTALADQTVNLIKNDQKIETELLKSHVQEMTETHSAIDFIGQDKLLRIVAPIVYEEKVVGFLSATETASFKLNRSQITSIKSFLTQTMKQLVEHDFKFLKDYKGSGLSHQKKTLVRIAEFINQNFKQSDLSLDAVSKKNNISYYYLSHLFKKELKTTFSNYLSNIRLDYASQLLKDRSLTVSQVSFSSGFEDPGYFSKVFKKHHGTSPVAFRDKKLSKRNKKK